MLAVYLARCAHRYVLQRDRKAQHLRKQWWVGRSLKSKARHRRFDLRSTRQIPEQNFEESEEFSYIDIGEERCSKIHIGILKRNLKGILFVKDPVPPTKK